MLAAPEGLEPPTLGSEDQCSIQLSYGAVEKRRLSNCARLDNPFAGGLGGCPPMGIAEIKIGVGNGNRTRNRRSHSPVLCQLSYSHRNSAIIATGLRCGTGRQKSH